MWLNRRDGKMLLLTFVVGCGIFAYVPDENFYLYCISGEILICFAADIIVASASRAVIWCCLSLVVIHLLGWTSKGFNDSDPYPYLVQMFEHAQLIACILMSNPILKRIKNG